MSEQTSAVEILRVTATSRMLTSLSRVRTSWTSVE